MAKRTHYTKPYLSQVETGKRAATPEVVSAYEGVFGVSLEVGVNRRELMSTLGQVAVSFKLVSELVASVASGDAAPLTGIQTTHVVDQAIATTVDMRAVRRLRGWMDDGNAVLRVNAAGILAKLPSQGEADRIVGALRHDSEVRDRYSVAVIARICGLTWPDAARVYQNPLATPYPALVAERFAHEARTSPDVGARWCSATMLQALSPVLGR
jgi:hypothetical protein